MRYVIFGACSAILLLPSLLFAWAWSGTLNFEVAVGSLILTIAAVKFFQQMRWIFAGVSACVIAVPPYPYWVRSGDDGSAVLHFFYGFTPSSLPWATFAAVFALAIALYYVIFWLLRRKT